MKKFLLLMVDIPVKYVILLLFFSFLTSLITSKNRNNNNIEKGQIYERFDTLNPFEPRKTYILVVLEVKNNYAKVVINGDTTSREIDLIKSLYKKVN